MSSQRESVSRRRFLGDAGTVVGGVVGAVAGGTLVGQARSGEPNAQDRPKPPSGKKIRLGVVGGGFGCSFYWHLHPNCTVEAVSDLQPERRAQLMQVYQCSKSYESLEKLILDDKVDAVAVFTDAPSHGRHCVAVMEHGKHVVSAVPAAMTLDDCGQLEETKRRTGLKYMMAETSYYHADVIAGRHLYRARLRGDLIYTEGHYYHHGVTRIGSWQQWRRALPPMLYPTHSTAYYVGVTGRRLTHVSCVGYRGKGEEWQQNRYDDNPFVSETALFRTSEETMCRINVFWWCGHPGQESGIWIWEKTAAPGENRPTQAALPPGIPPGGHGGSHGPLTHEFVTALAEDREPAIDVYEALAMTAPGIVAHQSALQGGRQLVIPSFDRA